MHCAGLTHSTHREPLQYGVELPHMPSPRQPTHRPDAVLQNGALVLGQFALLRHCAQTPASVLHSGAPGAEAQSPTAMQLFLHVRELGSHTGAAGGQSPACRHPTQSFSAVSQRPLFGQSLLVTHPTHVAVASSQMGVVPPQSPFLVHPRHLSGLPVHSGVAAGHPALLRQAPHWPPAQIGLLEGQSPLVRQATQLKFWVSQRGVEPEHCASVWHCSHEPLMQSGSPVGQSVAETHSTQRRLTGSQMGLLALHWVLAVHSTHRPLAGSHRGAAALVQLVLVHAVTQTLVRGSHSGAAVPQWVF